MVAARSATAAPTATAPRQGTKIVELLQREQGARLEELIAATGWLPHTAALIGRDGLQSRVSQFQRIRLARFLVASPGFSNLRPLPCEGSALPLS